MVSLSSPCPLGVVEFEAATQNNPPLVLHPKLSVRVKVVL